VASDVRGQKLVCPELSPEKLAELAELADFYKPRSETISRVNLATAAARRVQAKTEQQSRRGSDAPPEGELNYVRASLLRFGRESKVPRQFRPAMALGVTRPPFYLALPMTTKEHRGSGFYRILPENYEQNIGDDKRWPKWLYWRAENVPLSEKRQYLGRLRERTMIGVKQWRQKYLKELRGKPSTKTNLGKRDS
jgi:hypothetical protein